MSETKINNAIEISEIIISNYDNACHKIIIKNSRNQIINMLKESILLSEFINENNLVEKYQEFLNKKEGE